MNLNIWQKSTNYLLLSALFSGVVACNTQESPLVNIDKTPVVQATQGVSGQKLSVVANADLIPIAKLTIKQTNDEYVHCMGFLFESGKLITAAHCFKSIKTKSCSENVNVGWLYFAKTAEAPQLSGNNSKCEKISIYSDASNSDSSDLALVSFSFGAEMPSISLKLVEQKKIGAVPLVVWGSETNLDNYAEVVSQLPGEVTWSDTTAEKIFFYDSLTKGGYSGTPVFSNKNSSYLIKNYAEFSEMLANGVLGMHQGANSTNPIAIDAKYINYLLKSLPTLEY